MFNKRFSRLAGQARLGILVVAMLPILFAGRTLAQGDDTAAARPQLSIRVDATGLTVSGLVSSVAHDTILRDVVRMPEGPGSATFDLQEADFMPPGWALVTELALRAALRTQHSETAIDHQRVTVRGITTDPAGWNAAVARLTAALLPDMRLETQIIEVPPTPEFAELCRLQFSAITKNRSLRFAVGSSDLRTNGHPLLDSIVEAAADCPNAIIGIRVNGDGPASINANRSLAEARAKSIADYLMSHGLPMTRIQLLQTGDASGEAARQVLFKVRFAQASDGSEESSAPIS